MTIDFFVAVPDWSSGELVAARATSLGFSVSVEQDPKSGKWTCYCTKRIVPEYRTVTEIERTLDGIARQYGGYADGFGSYGNAAERDETR